MPNKSNQGSALAVVLVFLVLMSVLGAGILMLAQRSVLQSSGFALADKSYYAAESAAQIAAQVFIASFDKDGCYESETGVSITELAIIEERLKTRLRGNVTQKLSDLTEQINTYLSGLTFNQQEAVIDAVEIINFDSTIKSNRDIIETVNESMPESVKSDYIITYDVYVFLESPEFMVSVRSGGRTVSTQTGFEAFVMQLGENRTEPVYGSGSLPLADGSAFYQGKTGGIYGDSESEVFENYSAALTNLLVSADAEYSTFSSKAAILPSEGFPAQSHYDPNAAITAQYISAWSDVELGKDGQTTVYPNLEYIYSSNAIVIRGEVICPNLKGAVVNGGNIYGTFTAPSLENVYLGGGNLTIHSGAKINPMSEGPDGAITNQNRPLTGGSNIYGDRVLYVQPNVEINWWRFNMQSISIEYGTNGKLTSNSIFISRDWLETSGTASSDINRVIPQFYMRGYINLSKNIGTISGIFMTPDTRYVFDNGGGAAEGTRFVGMFYGNYDKHYSFIDGVHYYEHPIDATVEPFADKERSILMSGGIQSFKDSDGGTSADIPGTIEIIMDVEISPIRGLYLQETT